MQAGSRERILARLDQAAEKRCETATVPESRACFADYPKGGLKDLFAENFTRLKGEFHFASSIPVAADILVGILSGVPGPVAWEEGELLSLLRQASTDLQEKLEQSASFSLPSGDFAQYTASITGADALSARTGSLFITSSREGGRRLSVLPPIHIVLARESQLIETTAPWLSTLPEDDSWSVATIVSGPSRTADIEKILVLGAHGPKRLILIMVGA